MSPTNPLVAYKVTDPNTGVVTTYDGYKNRQLVEPTGPEVKVEEYTLEAIFGNAYFALGSWRPALIPRFTTQPASQTVDPGASVTFTAVTSGTPSATYQWYKNGAAIAGATGASYTIASAAGTDWGSYTVAATNSVGAVTSAAASLVVNDPEATWANGYGLDPAGNGAPAADPDNDGIRNDMEFFLGGNPTLAGNPTLPSATPSVSGPSAIIFEFDRLKDASAMGYIIEYATDLASPTTWIPAVVNGQGQNDATVTISTSPKGSTFEHVTATIPTNGKRIFVRLHL